MSSTLDVSARDDNASRQEMLDELKRALGKGFVESVLQNDDLWVRVIVDAWRDAAEICKTQLGCDYFCFLSGLDWMPADLSGEKVFGSIEGEEENTEAEQMTTGVAGGSSRFQVFMRLYSTTKFVGITLKADVDEQNPIIPSIVSLFAGAEWHEREAWEMYGFNFDGHPGLRHLYLPGEFEGHPLRKDFPLLAREVKPWPGLVDVEPIPGEENADDEGGDS